MSRRSKKKRSRKSGLPPGTLVHIGEVKVGGTKITIIDYNEGGFEEKDVKNLSECCEYRDKATVTWINVGGLHEIPVIEKIGKDYGLHPLLMEDILNTEQRPKLEDYENHVFIVLKMLHYDEPTGEVKTEQVSLVLGKNFVISFQENGGDVFDPIRDRIRHDKGRIRKLGPDYLCYGLIDAIVDNYFVILEKLGEATEDLEDELVASPTKDTINKIHNLRREFLYLRKSVWPLREVISAMQRDDSELIRKDTQIYLRDIYDHTVQAIDNIETFREILAGMLDIYLSSLSNKMNEVMKVLTIIATIFIPLTFIAGVYGMNFKYMPEIDWDYGYYFAWGIMVAVGAIMIIYFKKNKWL